MKISIISAVYNKEKYLSKHINSLLNQTYKNIEFIFVNDGSSDNSLTILNDFKQKDNRILIINQKNQGPNIARKNGFLKATGEYVYFVDSDDCLYDNNVINKIINVIINNNPDCIFAQMITSYDNKDVLDKCIYINNIKEKKYTVDILYNFLFRGSLSCKIFKREKIKENFFINMKNYEDYYLSYCTLNNCKDFYYLDEPIYIINRKNENNSLTSKFNFDNNISKYEIIELLEKKCPNFKCSIQKLLTKVYLDDLNQSTSLNKKDTQKLLKFLKEKKVNFNEKFAISNHYKKLIHFRIIYSHYYSNRMIRYIRNALIGLKKSIKWSVK